MKGDATRRDLELALQQLKAVKTHLARARMGLRGTDDRAAFAIQRELASLRERLTGIRRRVGKPERQADLGLGRAA